jgi:type II secretory ATPase GspE/PulE/Tfp pilus assembly ATPase PilB-like protein
VATQDEMKALLEEFSIELKNTDYWKRDPKASFEGLYREWVQNFANEKGQFTLYSPVGCDTCSGTGYKGRVGLHELLIGSDSIKKHIQEHARVADIVATALSENMRTLKQDGIEKVLKGSTDMKKVRAVCIK